MEERRKNLKDKWRSEWRKGVMGEMHGGNGIAGKNRRDEQEERRKEEK